MNIFKEALLLHIESTIDYRKSKALKHPGDVRNLTCVAELGNAAETVKALPDDHSLFTKLESANQFECDCWNERESQFISHWGLFNTAIPADSGSRFIAKLAESADKYLTQHNLEKVAEKLYGKFIDYFNDHFIEGFNIQMWEFFEGKFTDEFMIELAEEYRNELAMMFVEECMEELADELASGEFGTESDMDKTVSERMERNADKIREEWANEFIGKVGDKIWNE